ncbi:MAG: hypothetical protein MJK12_17435 [Colwellia sp.]|nr:hypothetical protein [Colwellia sp.]
MKIIKVIKSVAVATTLMFSSLSFAADIDVNANPNDLAIHGYDAVSYFTDSKAIKGSNKYTASYKSAIYQFSSEKNRDQFQTNPNRFAPQFGGFCV